MGITQSKAPEHPQIVIPIPNPLRPIRSREEFFAVGTIPVDISGTRHYKDCSICLEDLQADVLEILTCGHQYHTHCLMNRFANKKKGGKCPNCRAQLYQTQAHQDSRALREDLNSRRLHAQLSHNPFALLSRWLFGVCEVVFGRQRVLLVTYVALTIHWVCQSQLRISDSTWALFHAYAEELIMYAWDDLVEYLLPIQDPVVEVFWSMQELLTQTKVILSVRKPVMDVLVPFLARVVSWKEPALKCLKNMVLFMASLCIVGSTTYLAVIILLDGLRDLHMVYKLLTTC